MNGGTRLLAGIGAVVLVVGALGIASPSGANAIGELPTHSTVSINP